MGAQGGNAGTMDRRLFLRLTGLVAAATAIKVPTVAAQTRAGDQALPTLYAPGAYQITGRVRLEEPLVAITGIANAQQISWADLDRIGAPSASFTTFESFDRPWQTPDIVVRGGKLEALQVVPLDVA
jgi:hypothetical protein